MASRPYKQPRASFGRTLRAMRFAWTGVRSAYREEAAFRQEVWAFALLGPLTVMLPLEALKTAFLLFMMGAVLTAELMNSAIEATLDRLSLEHHELTGFAKDCAAGAVLVMNLTFASVWLYLAGPVLWQRAVALLAGLAG